MQQRTGICSHLLHKHPPVISSHLRTCAMAVTSRCKEPAGHRTRPVHWTKRRAVAGSACSRPWTPTRTGNAHVNVLLGLRWARSRAAVRAVVSRLKSLRTVVRTRTAADVLKELRQQVEQSVARTL